MNGTGGHRPTGEPGRDPMTFRRSYVEIVDEAAYDRATDARGHRGDRQCAS